MTEWQENLWQKINRFEIDDPDSAFSFTDRLARENGWSLTYAIRAVTEYKKFMFLICIAPHPLTPSDEVDQVWHLHLIYTQSYWVDFCEKTIERTIHHGPTKGGNSEKAKYADLYAKTLEFYKEIFDTEPPKDIWPQTDVRFRSINFTRINRHKYWLLPKWRWK
ncbi:MAG: hypothetical protein H6607_12895 [Flavobacteriales bacterium]|nr:hypothetical protein [Flavobacteriales bacterium]